MKNTVCAAVLKMQVAVELACAQRSVEKAIDTVAMGSVCEAEISKARDHNGC